MEEIETAQSKAVVASPALTSPLSPQRTRGYFSLRYGLAFFADRDIAPGLELSNDPGTELLSASIGFNWGRYLSIELATDYYEGEIEALGLEKVGEYTIYGFVPQLRLRYPLFADKLTPYLVGGAGVGFTEFNDQTALGAASTTPQFNGKDTGLIYTIGEALNTSWPTTSPLAWSLSTSNPSDALIRRCKAFSGAHLLRVTSAPPTPFRLSKRVF